MLSVECCGLRVGGGGLRVWGVGVGRDLAASLSATTPSSLPRAFEGKVGREGAESSTESRTCVGVQGNRPGLGSWATLLG